jgi:hypothetical protein
VSNYASRVLTKQFPDLAVDETGCWITIRNPQTLAPAELTDDVSSTDLTKDEHGEVVVDEATTKATYRIGAKLVIGMHVPDFTAPVELDDQGRQVPGPEAWLPTKPGPADVSKLPLPMITWLGEAISAVNPQQTPAAPTSTTS